MKAEPDTSLNALDLEFDRRKEKVLRAYDKYHSYLLSYVYQLCGNYHTAEDIMQEFWIHVLHRFKEEHILALPILRRKVRQKKIDFLRPLRMQSETAVEDFPTIASPNNSDAEPMSSEEERKLERDFWEEFEGIALNAKQKKAIWLHARYSHTYLEIEGILGVPTSTICDWIRLAKSRFSEYLENDGIKTL